MTISDFLADSVADLPEPGTAGVEGNWLPVATLHVTMGSLWAGDPYVMNAEDGILIDVPNGRYIFEAKGMDFGGRRVVSRVRVFLCGARPVSGQHIGDTGTDTGIITVCDLRALEDVVGGQNGALQEFVMNHDYQLSGHIHIGLNRGFDLPYVEVAFGDNDAKTFALESNGIRVGFELEFLAPDYRYNDDDV